MFCQEPELQNFHPLFMSCNEPVGGTQWCARCDKCAFMCLLLSAWLPATTVVHTVFQGVDMLADEALLRVFLPLIGSSGSKPFDCVGTAEEARAAVHLAAIRRSKEWRTSKEEASTEPVAESVADDRAEGISTVSNECCLPVVLCKLCENAGISVKSDGSVQDMEYEAVLQLWGLDGH